MVTVVDAATAPVVTLKVALVAPAGTVTLGGTATAALLLESVTCAPPAGAAALSVAVPVAVPPPVTLAGVTASTESAGATEVLGTRIARHRSTSTGVPESRNRYA